MTKQFYEISAENSKEATCPDEIKSKSFKVMATSHIQHHPGSTKLQGLSTSGDAKIKSLREQGYWLGVTVGGRLVTLDN